MSSSGSVKMFARVLTQAPEECQQEMARLHTQLKNLEIQFQKQQQQIQRLRSLRDKTSTHTDEFFPLPGQTEYTGDWYFFCMCAL